MRTLSKMGVLKLEAHGRVSRGRTKVGSSMKPVPQVTLIGYIGDSRPKSQAAVQADTYCLEQCRLASPVMATNQDDGSATIVSSQA